MLARDLMSILVGVRYVQTGFFPDSFRFHFRTFMPGTPPETKEPPRNTCNESQNPNPS